MSDEDENQKSLLAPVLSNYLAKQNLQNLLKSKIFCHIIKRIDQSDDEVKSLLIDTFWKEDIDEFQVSKKIIYYYNVCTITA